MPTRTKGDRVHIRATLGALTLGAAVAAGIATAAPAQAAAGSLDPSFGSNGIITPPAGVGTPTDIVTLTSGEFLVLASATDPGTGESDIAVLRYQANGALDTSFGTGGEALASFPNMTAGPGSLFVQPGGQIVVVGGASPLSTVDGVTSPSGPPQAVLAEFNANGTLDTSFGSGGEVTTELPSPIGTGIDSLNTVLVQPDGKILAGGGVQGTSCNPRRNCVNDTVLARYNPNGTLDTSFGSGGTAEVNAKSFGITAVSEDTAGNIFVQNGVGGGQPTLGEFSTAGVPDSTVAFPPSDAITVSATNGFQPNGTFAEGMSVKLTSNTFSPTDAQVKVLTLPSGAVDPNFSNAPFDYANESGTGINNIQGLAFGATGDVVTAGLRCPGFGRSACSGTDQIGVARLTPTGSLDPAFGSGGVTTISAGDQVNALAIQSNGDVLVAFQNGSSVAIARVLG
jgi:uncharacterized delta-60 repeat protein